MDRSRQLPGNLLNDELFWTSLYNTLYYTALAVPIGVVVAMGLALAMNQPVPEVPIYRAILYLPSIIPLFALSFIFLILMNPTQGIFNQLPDQPRSAQRQLVRRSGLDQARLRLHRPIRRRTGRP